jgi:hypothetical protein
LLKNVRNSISQNVCDISNQNNNKTYFEKLLSHSFFLGFSEWIILAIEASKQWSHQQLHMAGFT